MLLLLPLICGAVDRLSLDLDTIIGENWRLHGVRVGLSDLTEARQTLTLTIDRLDLPKPFDVLTFVDINCANLRLDDDGFRCRQGDGIIKSPWLDSSKVNFSFHYSDNKKTFNVSNIRFAGGRAGVAAEFNRGNWNLRLDAKALNITQLKQLFPRDAVELSGGRVSLRADAEIDAAGLNKVKFNAELTGIGLQTQDGRFAGEELAAAIFVKAVRGQKRWFFDSETKYSKGAVYIEPIYLEITDRPVELKAKGVWQSNGSRLELTEASLNHPGLGVITGQLQLLTGERFALDNAQLTLTTNNLSDLTTTYVQPFLETSSLEGLHFAGELDARIKVVQQALTQLGIKFTDLDIADDGGRIMLQRGQGIINWSDRRSSNSQTELAWQRLKIFNVPVAASALSLSTDAGSIELNRQTALPVLGGIINIERFNWYKNENQEPDVHFIGAVNDLSLQQLSKALDWQPLYGTITGNIPGVSYRQGRLEIDGELNARLFDGEIRIKKLASSGLFSDFPRLYADIEIDNLDLKQLTQTFDFGGMEGRLSGHVRNLYLEDWHPVTFYAWFGTPEDDTSRHRISQKAVENITSIGGGGAADLLSRSFLRFFDNFRYDKLGIGCYLYQGVCQLMGVGTTRQGYIIVKGGGLPRIDVIGYNPRVDWSVLMERLKRVTGSNEAVIN